MQVRVTNPPEKITRAMLEEKRACESGIKYALGDQSELSWHEGKQYFYKDGFECAPF